MADCWTETHGGAAQNQSARGAGSACEQGVSRGGSWANIQHRTRSAARNKYPADYRNGHQGVRLARDMSP
jgi:formylglycine-generating enzyme required for sulfatase activity